MNPLSVFTPSREITTIDRFAGRTEELQTLSEALEIDGDHIIIYGNRGTGKSSLARQLVALSEGSADVKKKLRNEPFSDFDFLTVFLQCDDSIKSIPDLLVRLLSDTEALAEWVPFRVVSRDLNTNIDGGVNVRIFNISAGRGQLAHEQRQEVEADLFSVFVQSVRRLAQSEVSSSGVLLVIDEFDRIENKSGMASLLKMLGSERVKFALVGVAKEVQELISEHESVSRQLAGGCVLVPPMSPEEMDEIFDLAETALNASVNFPRETRDWIISSTKGHPFLLHLIARFALAATLRTQLTSVSLETAKEAVFEIATKSAAPIQENQYKSAIGHSFKRELILKELASVEDDEIHTQDVYARAAQKLGITPNAVSVYVGHLASDTYGAVIEKSRDRYYRFHDSLFKAYCAARPFQLSARTGEAD